MKLTVIGGTGLIGSQVVQKLTAAGHQAAPAALSTGVDLITGKGLDQALESAEVVINLANSPTFDEASLDFFRTSMTNLLAAGQSAGVRHQVILSIVGVDQVPQLDYFRAKTLQEELLRQGPTPYSIVRAIQFFEFVNAVLSWTSDAATVRLPATRLQPMAAADVADAVVEVSTSAPLRGIRNVAGPDVFPLDELGRGHPGDTAGRPDRPHRRPGRHVRGRYRRCTHRRTRRTPGTHALPGLDPKRPITGRSESPRRRAGSRCSDRDGSAAASIDRRHVTGRSGGCRFLAGLARRRRRALPHCPAGFGPMPGGRPSLSSVDLVTSRTRYPSRRIPLGPKIAPLADRPLAAAGQ